MRRLIAATAAGTLAVAAGLLSATAASAAGTAEVYVVHGIPNLPVDVCVNGALGTVVAIVRNAVLGGCMTVVGSRGGWCRVRGVRSAGRGHSPGRTARRSCTRSPAPTVQPGDAGGGRVVGHGRGCDTGVGIHRSGRVAW